MKHTNFSHLMICVFMCCISQPMVAISQNYTITIDDSIQPIVEAEMKSRLQTTEAEWACAILMDKNNQVVALFDTDSTAANIVQPTQMGTIMQPFGIMSALRTGNVPAGNKFSIVKSSYQDYAGYLWIDGSPIDSVLDIPSVIAISSKIGTCQIMEQAFDKDHALFAQYMSELGVRIVVDSLEDVLRYANGIGEYISPIQLTLLYSHLFQRQLSPEIWNSTDIILDGLHQSVWNNDIGSSSRGRWTNGAQSEIVPIMGKTGSILMGTGEKLPPSTISFVGAFPEDAPQYTCPIMFHKAKYPASANVQCAVPVMHIAEQIYNLKSN